MNTGQTVPTTTRRQQDGFLDVLSDLFIGLINSTGGPIVILLFVLAAGIIIYAACCLYRMCQDEFKNGDNPMSLHYSSEYRKPLPRRVYEIQAEEGVLDGVFLGGDDFLENCKLPVWKPALPIEAFEELERLSFEPKKKRQKMSFFKFSFCCQVPEEGIAYV